MLGRGFSVDQIGEPSRVRGIAKCPVHVRDEPAPLGARAVVAPPFAVAAPTGISPVTFRDHEVNEAVDLNAGFDNSPYLWVVHIV